MKKLKVKLNWNVCIVYTCIKSSNWIGRRILYNNPTVLAIKPITGRLIWNIGSTNTKYLHMAAIQILINNISAGKIGLSFIKKKLLCY